MSHAWAVNIPSATIPSATFLLSPRSSPCCSAHRPCQVSAPSMHAHAPPTEWTQSRPSARVARHHLCTDSACSTTAEIACCRMLPAALGGKMGLPYTATLALSGPLGLPEMDDARAWFTTHDDDMEDIQARCTWGEVLYMTPVRSRGLCSQGEASLAGKSWQACSHEARQPSAGSPNLHPVYEPRCTGPRGSLCLGNHRT